MKRVSRAGRGLTANGNSAQDDLVRLTVFTGEPLANTDERWCPPVCQCYASIPVYWELPFDYTAIGGDRRLLESQKQVIEQRLNQVIAEDYWRRIIRRDEWVNSLHELSTLNVTDLISLMSFRRYSLLLAESSYFIESRRYSGIIYENSSITEHSIQVFWNWRCFITWQHLLGTSRAQKNTITNFIK
jgi:hypothetical protein